MLRLRPSIKLKPKWLWLRCRTHRLTLFYTILLRPTIRCTVAQQIVAGAVGASIVTTRINRQQNNHRQATNDKMQESAPEAYDHAIGP